MSILIGNNLFIGELPIDYNGKILDLDPYIVPLNAFFDKLEVNVLGSAVVLRRFRLCLRISTRRL